MIGLIGKDGRPRPSSFPRLPTAPSAFAAGEPALPTGSMPMSRTHFNFRKMLAEELDTEKLQRNFLSALLELQNVERGSIWVKTRDGYLCVEAAGSQSEAIRGVTIPADQQSIVGWVIDKGRMTVAEPGKDDRHYGDFEEQLIVKSTLILCFPLFLKSGEVYGAIQIIDTSAEGNRLNLNEDYLKLLEEIIDLGSMALSNSLIHANQVQENLRLKQTIEAMRDQGVLIGRSEPFLRTFKTAVDYAKTDFPVLITGESGTGKELIAREIHRQSNRSAKPFMVQNCSAIPETLLESELFGYVKGAFTGAVKDKIGLFEAADGGTLFLDEIGDMPFHLQARMLRVLQNSEIKPLGGTLTKKIDVRIISATNKDLKEAIAREQFREDLFYRLNVLPLHMPPLRERPEDTRLLLDHMLSREAVRMGMPAKRFAKDALEFLLAHPWKGNVRELENFVRRIIIVTDTDLITFKDLAPHFAADEIPPAAPAEEPAQEPGRQSEPGHQEAGRPSFEGYTWESLEREYVLYLLEKNKWHVTRAAKEAGVIRSTFDSRMKKLGIRK
jgi:transcriptional regulator with GAF, ATPase, and Fis domain